MSLTLNEIELRVLGVLLEKAMTTPNAYPLTINSIVLGANQLQNRDPVMNIKDGDVSRALQSLGHKRLVTQAPPGAGARANKYQHTVVDTLHWDRREQAIMVELMLRGPQTPGELRTRSSRMSPLPDLTGALNVLEGLGAHDPPFVEELPREPGRASNRYRHLLGEASGAAPPEPARSGPTGVPIEPTAGLAERPTSDDAEDGLSARLGALEVRVQSLERRLLDIEKNRGGSDPGRSDSV